MDTSPYLHLEPEHIKKTVAALHRRIEARFSERGIAQVCQALCQIANESAERARSLSRPIHWLRAISFCAVVCIFLPFALVSSSLEIPDSGIPLTEFVQSLEAGLNDVLLIGAAIYFLFSLERRIRRIRALAALDELRSIAHIIDMHQLTKDPEEFLRNDLALPGDTQHAALTSGELSFYLDYCSEMLSLIGKIAALYAANLDDGIVLQAVNEVESLTTGLSNKIWQKIIILNQVEVFAK